MNKTRRLAHYELLREIGRGGMGVVYQAYDTTLRRKVAIKVLPAAVSDAPGRRARLLREARAAAKLNHPAIATIYEVGETLTEDSELALFSRELIYIAMEYVDGEDLSWRLQEGLSIEEAVEFGAQIAEGLASAHRSGVIHRDLKPGNVRITPDGRIKILDFGLAKIDESDVAPDTPTEPVLTKTGVVVGTVPYMAPEQFEGETVDDRADLFSLGVILYQMLTGHLPFSGGRMVDYVRSLANDLPESPSKSNPEIPERLARLVERLLAKDPENRLSSAAATAGELRSIASGDPGSVLTQSGSTYRTLLRPMQSRLRAGHRWPGKRAWLALSLAFVALLLAGVGWGLLRAHRSPPPVRNVAVLPFENRTDDRQLDAFYEGIGAALTRKLSRVPGLNVISELDVRRYRGSTKTAEEIARELDVGTLIQGYVQGGAEKIVAVAHLMNAIPSVAVWDVEIEGSPDQLLDLQERLADDVIRHLPVSLSTRERQRLRENPTGSREAYRFYAQGSSALSYVDSQEAAERAVTLFERAIAADGEFSWAHAGLSQALLRRYRESRSSEYLEEAVAAAQRAVELEPDLAEPRITRARAWRFSGMLDEAITDLLAVLETSPDSDAAHRELAISTFEAGDLDLAERSHRRALEIRPLAWQSWNQLGAFLLETGRYVDARKHFLRAAELAPEEIIRPLENLGTLALNQGDLKGALVAYEKIPESLRTPSLLASMGTFYFMLGRLSSAETCFRQAVGLQPEEPLHWLNLGDTELRLSSEEEARRTYRQGVLRLEEQLAHNPDDARLRSVRPALLAKAGDCAHGIASATSLRPSLAGRLEELIWLAKAFAVCRERDQTLETLGDLVNGGMSAERLRQEFEFEWLAGDSEFESLLGEDG